MPDETLALDQARRVALAAQGFDRPPPKGPVTTRHLREAIHRIGLLQIDFVNLVAPSHYLVLFSRLGAYRRSLLDDLVFRRREFTEQWAHEASIVPMELWPLLRHRRERHRVRPYGFESFLGKHPDYVAWVLEQVRARGPLAAADLSAPPGVDRRIPGDWFGSVPRATLEAHFGRGALAIAARRPGFVRVYDLAERVIPARHFRDDRTQDAQRELLRRAARAHGVATAADLADYYRMPVAEARPRISELVEEGHIRQVQVEGAREAFYLARDARAPGTIEGASLLSPFDPLIWRRARAARLFGFDYRFEIFVPPHKRKWGAYVLPFRLGDRLAARVDLKADRENRLLRVRAAYLEPGAAAKPVAAELAEELRALGSWLGLDGVVVERKGDLARALASAIRDT